MENNIQPEITIKKSIWDSPFFRTILVLLIIILLAALGYFVYEKYFKESKKDSNNDNVAINASLSKKEILDIIKIRNYEDYLNSILDYKELEEIQNIDFTKPENDKIKAEFLLLLIDYVDDSASCVFEEGDVFETCYISKNDFEYKEKQIYGQGATIDVTKLGEIYSSHSCAIYKYNESLQKFERGTDACGNGSEGRITEDFYELNYRFSKTSNGYEVTSKIPYYTLIENEDDDFDDTQPLDCYLSLSSNSENITRIANCEREEIETYVENNLSKFYTRKYTYIVDGDNLYISSRELIKD